MSVAVHENSSVPLEDDRGRSLLTGWIVRILLSAIGVIVSYQFEWHALRHVTADLNMRLDALFGLQQDWAGAESLLWNGRIFSFVNACTFVDVAFGAIPLLWRLRWSVQRNVIYLITFLVGLFAFNVVRLSISDLIFAAGVPWWLAHEVVAGAAYCAVWIWIWEHRDWKRSHSGVVASSHNPVAS